MSTNRQEASNGLEILANILKYCSAKTSRNILAGMQKDPRCAQIVSKLRQQIVLFEDLAYADERGVQKMLKLVRLKDLALSLKGCSQSIVKNVAKNMSKHSLCDLKEEIAQAAYANTSDIEEAQERVMAVAKDLIKNREMYIVRANEKMVY